MSALLSDGADAAVDFAANALSHRHALTQGSNAESESSVSLLPTRFQQVAHAHANADAIIDGQRTIQYGRLNDLTNRVARFLRANGVGRGHRVGIHMDRSLEFVAAVLAVLKAGAAYVPMATDHPADRLQFMIRDLKVGVLLTEGHVSAEVAAAASQLWTWDDVLREADTLDASDPVPVNQPEDPAYVMFTSGSTGVPKGVLVPHRAIARLVLKADFLPWGPDLRFLLLAPTAFDASTLELWGPLLHGGTLVVVRDKVASLERIEEQIRDARVNTLWLTAGLFNQFIDQRPEALRGIRYLLTGGDALSVPHVLRALDTLPETELINGYGPTEGTTFTTTYAIPRDGSLKQRDNVPIGRPLADTFCYILGHDLRPVPDGTAGELYIGGDGVALGYWERPDLNAAAFLPDPFRGAAGANMYRSGDRVRRLPDGNLEFLGRIDDQLKIRGHRVEPGEVEAALVTHPAVRSAVVVARRTQSGDKELVGIVVLAPEHRVSSTDLRRFLQAKLPEAVIPTRWESISVLPLNANGKVDRASLAATEGLRLADSGERVGPRNGEERRWLALWERVLARTNIGVLDDFFSIGGHSLAALRLVAAARTEFGVPLPSSAVFDHRTIAALAQCVASPPPGHALTSIPICQTQSGPASTWQEQMVFLHSAAGDPATYHVAFAYRLRGRLDAGRLANAWTAVLRRHAILRTRFLGTGDVLQQEIVDLGHVGLESDEWPAAPDADTEPAVHRWLTEFARRPFRLEASPLWRLRLLRFSAEDHLLAFVVHHALVDEWALREIFSDFAAAYERGDLPEPTPGRPFLRYLDYALWQRSQLSPRPAESDLAYWRRELASLPADLSLPFDHPRPAVDPSTGGLVTRLTTPEFRSRFDALARQLGCSPFVLGLAAFEVFLSRLSGQDDVVALTLVSNRDRAELQGVAGCFINTVPIRVRMGSNPNFRDVVRLVGTQVRDAMAHGELPTLEISRIVRESQASNDARLPRVVFVLLNDPWPEVRLEGLSSTPIQVHTATSKMDLMLSMTVSSGGGWQMDLEYATSLFLPATAERLMRWWETLLQGLVQAPDAPVSRLPLLNATERQQLLTWGSGAVSEPDTTLVPALLKQQAQRTPTAEAVVWENERWTFAELDAQSDRLAAQLARRGVGPDTVVGLCLERSPQLILAIVGILKAGGAYLPLDPTQPAERLAFMLRDSGAAVVVTNRAARPRVDGVLPEVIDLDGSSEWAATPGEAPLPTVLGEHLAYVMYTSGSTGRPKAVMIPHRALNNYLAWMRREFPPAEQEVVLQSTTSTFDISVWEILYPLVTGAKMVLARPDGTRDTGYLAELIRRHEVTFAQFVPSLLGLLIHEPVFRECRQLRRIFCGGEAMTLELMRGVQAATPADLYNMYGPTEATIWATSWHCRPGHATSPPIGVPLANTQAYVLDVHGDLTPTGIMGELYLGGRQLARGYLNRPELTAEKFLPDRFGGKAGDTIYRTGDLARWRPDGTLEYLGRQDDQVKIRGFRIELGEIQAALLEHPSIEQAAVLARTGSELVGYLVPRPGATVALDGLRQHLGSRLPEYMVPTGFVILEAFPLTANGKVDRRTLATLAGTELREVKAFEPPKAGIEEQVAAIWCEILQRPCVGRNDHFFELGGHSLLAMKVAARVSSALHRQVGVQLLFTAPVLARFCTAVEAAVPIPTENSGPRLKALPRRAGRTST
ncbi:MAG: amino acid adenylation domain-containing protein [Verrucomicrobiales bacterium]|nr:amino acid adenylation domain-containing protein [Verrucomicrobiales bacterium]